MPRASRYCCFAMLGLLFAARADAAVPLPTGSAVAHVDFERHVMGLFGRAGCNLGSCHGSFQGKGGFRLSLFGFDPDKDFWSVTRDQYGRRLNPNRSVVAIASVKPLIGRIEDDIPDLDPGAGYATLMDAVD